MFSAKVDLAFADRSILALESALDRRSPSLAPPPTPAKTEPPLASEAIACSVPTSIDISNVGKAQAISLMHLMPAQSWATLSRDAGLEFFGSPSRLFRASHPIES
jgi:hypothetical protein